MASKFTREQLNTLNADVLVELFLQMQDRLEEQTAIMKNQAEQLEVMGTRLKDISDQLALEKRHRYGTRSEKMDDPNQIRFMEVDGEIVFFNEAEAVADLSLDEPEAVDVQGHKRKKHAGKKEEDLSGLPVERVDHYLTDKELHEEFGGHGYKRLPDAVMTELIFVPAKVKVLEHHIGVYADKKDDHMIKAPHPAKLLRGSSVSASLAAAIMNAKYVNALPLYRQEKEFERYGLCIPRANMANWMIRLAEEYFGIIYDYMHALLLMFSVIQADESPVLVSKDGRAAGSKSYIWMYRSGVHEKNRHIILYDYQKTRNTSHPREFLRGYKGICTTDGYQVYHTLEKEQEDLVVAGCWVHMRRRFEQALSLIPKSAQKGTVLYNCMKQIQAIYREEGKLKDLPPDERLNKRIENIQPLVDAFFAYLKINKDSMSKQAKVQDAFGYALNQEKYLRVFLTNGEVPIDNNASERAIKGFCIGRKNWMMIDTISGAKSSAIIYSIAETAKANNLKPYDYFEYLLEEIPKHMEDKNRDFLEDLLPWSDKLPERIRKPMK